MRAFLVGVVGPCASGKSTLVAELNSRGYSTRHIAQEHSYVADMWQRITNPDVLVFLEVSYPLTIQRKQLNWTQAEYEQQIFRLRHAQEHADLIINTDELSIQQVRERVLHFLAENSVGQSPKTGV